MSHTIYGPGGYDPAKPNSNVLLWADDATRTASAASMAGLDGSSKR